MKTPIRIIINCATLCLVILVVAGCSKNNENTGNTKGSEMAARTESATSTASAPDGGGAIAVASLTTQRGQQGVVIPVKLTNDVSLRGIVLPLQIHHLDTGAFISGLKLSFGDRLPYGKALSDIQFTNQYLTPDGNCKGGKQGGYQTVFAYDTLMHDVTVSPAGLLFARQRMIADDFLAGADKTGSFIITVNVTNTPGRFEIDTTCADPANHLLLIKPDVSSVIPSFTKGTITIQ